MDQFAWSATRGRMFQECRRKYYYRYHLAPLARRPDPPPEAVEAGRVKDLIGLETWAGSLVHEIVQQILNRWRAGRDMPEEQALEQATRMLSRQFRSSGLYWNAHPDEFPSRPVLLDLHYYGDGTLARERAARIKERVADSIRAFLRSELARLIRWSGPANWLPIDRNAAAHVGEDLLILVKPDFAFREEGLIRIFDWKTGRPDPFWETIQLTCYALYAAERWHCELGQVVPEIVYLYPEFRFSETEYSPDSVRDVQLFIRESQHEILSLAASGGTPAIDRFPLAEDPGSCRWCQFRGMCDGMQRGSSAHVSTD